MMRINDKEFDKKLNITTTGVRESKNHLHSRYEATPYQDLKELYEIIKLNEDDHLVDFGSGRGRVCFYTHYLFKCHVTGVEANASTFDEAIDNINTYYLKIEDDHKINFKLMFAEDFKVLREHNVFFFFNPFDVSIFKKVLNKIDKSLNENPRDYYIILAYPFLDYVNYVLEHTNFIISNFIEADLNNNHGNKFLILSNK